MVIWHSTIAAFDLLTGGQDLAYCENWVATPQQAPSVSGSGIYKNCQVMDQRSEEVVA